MSEFLYIDRLTFTYENAIQPLFQFVSFQLQSGWTGVVGANGSGKTTLLQLICGLLKPDSGRITGVEGAWYCEQRTDFMPADFPGFQAATEKPAVTIRHRLGIGADWDTRWDTLSHGERKRCQIAVALYKNPSLLAVDEPSNHLDLSSKKILFHALSSYRGIGLLVSHDRALLDDLCRHTLFIFPPAIEIRKTGYSSAAREIERENAHRVQEFKNKRKEVRKLRKKVNRQKQKAGRADGLRSKRGLSPRDHDAKAKKDLARLTGKDGVDGRKLQRMKTQLQRAEDEQTSIVFRKSSTLGIAIENGIESRFFPIFIKPRRLSLGDGKKLEIPDLCITMGEKIGLMGDNGAGKSTFLEHMLPSLNLPSDRVIYIRQEISARQSAAMVRRVQRYDRHKKGQMMALISRLGSDPVHLLDTKIPSPGEVRKLMLAEGIMRNPSLIVMDEPTNHMDLPSIRCVESALKECACSQLLVSHDRTFLKEVVSSFWFFEKEDEGTFAIHVRGIPE
jgi:ATPase subunit of ABC transporter with duplicated ATPase domains